MQNKGIKKLLIFLSIYSGIVMSAVKCENETNVNEDVREDFAQELVEQGRTFVHRTLKRFMIIAPAIFFKLGIAFTLLLLVTLVAVNNGFIGFLILVVGLSSVLARLQGSAAPLVRHVPVPYASVQASPLHTLPYHHHPWIDRSDSVDVIHTPKRNGFAENSGYDSNSDLRNTGVYLRNRFSDAKSV